MQDRYLILNHLIRFHERTGGHMNEDAFAKKFWPFGEEALQAVYLYEKYLEGERGSA